MHLVLLGSRGFIGSEFVRQMRLRSIGFTPIMTHEYDFADPTRLIKCLSDIRPNAVVNCAGYTGKPNVDACESEKRLCLLGNTILPGTIALACSELNIPMGHVSSGCIFIGRREDGKGFSEMDPPNFSFRQNNCSFYSGTKALGEEILDRTSDCYIWRIRIPFSNYDSSRNYLSKLMRYDRLLDAENSVSDLDELVNACLDCIINALPFGVYNLTNPGSITTREIVRMLSASGLTNKKFTFFESESEFMKLAAVTPRSNCILDSSKALNAGLTLTDVRPAIQRAIDTWQPQTSSPKG